MGAPQSAVPLSQGLCGAPHPQDILACRGMLQCACAMSPHACYNAPVLYHGELNHVLPRYMYILRFTCYATRIA